MNNAGIGIAASIVEMTLADWQRQQAINLDGVFLGIKHAARVMKPQGSGVIVNTSSTAGVAGGLGPHAYTAAKHGLIGYMDALRSEVSVPHNIQVTNVLPGSVATDVSRNAVTEDGSRRGKSDANIDAGDDPMDCARAILDAVENNVPELIFAKGMELDLARMRHENPKQLFELAGQLGAQLAAEGPALRADPGVVRVPHGAEGPLTFGRGPRPSGRSLLRPAPARQFGPQPEVTW